MKIRGDYSWRWLRDYNAKPRIYWTYYPRSRRGYWRVSHIPIKPTKRQRDLWQYAHTMCQQMNRSNDP